MNLSRKLLLALMVNVGASTVAAQPPAVHELSRSEFEALLAKPAELLILDLRQPDEVSKVGGFPVYLSAQSEALQGELAWIPTGRTIVTVSNHKGRSGRAAALLIAHGFKVAGSVGAKTYEEQGGKLSKIAPRAVAAAPVQGR